MVAGKEGEDRGQGTDGSKEGSDTTQVDDQALNPPFHHDQGPIFPSLGLSSISKAPEPGAKEGKRQGPKGQLSSHIGPDRDTKPQALSSGWLA